MTQSNSFRLNLARQKSLRQENFPTFSWYYIWFYIGYNKLGQSSTLWKVNFNSHALPILKYPNIYNSSIVKLCRMTSWLFTRQTYWWLSHLSCDLMNIKTNACSFQESQWNILVICAYYCYLYWKNSFYNSIRCYRTTCSTLRFILREL